MVSLYVFGVNKLLAPIAEREIQCHSLSMMKEPLPTSLEPILQPEDRILIVAPSGPVPEEPFKSGCKILRDWGLELCFSDGLWSKDRYLAGPDSARMQSLVEAIVDQDARLVWMARGGYGATRLHGELLKAFPEAPLPLIGFSDGTALHAVYQRSGNLSFHGPVVTQLHRLSEESLNQCHHILFAPSETIQFPSLTALSGVEHSSPAPIWGGNLALLTAMVGTHAHVDCGGKLIFLEDVGETTYRIDRMIQQLVLSGAFDNAAGLVLGHFTGGSSRDDEWNDILWQEVASKLPCPVWKGLAVGHGEENWMVPLGGEAQIQNNVLKIQWGRES